MKRQYFQILFHIGDPTKAEKKSVKTLHKGQGFAQGISQWCENKRTKEKTFKVFLSGRQPDSEFIDSFYHEMTHVLVRLMGIKVSRQKHEHLSQWIGYLCKIMFRDRLTQWELLGTKPKRTAGRKRD